MGIGITGANVGYSRAAADDRFAKASSPTQTITAGTISASEYTGGLINGNTIIDSDVGKTFRFVGSFTGGADVTLLQTKTSPYVYSSDGENTPAATGAWYGVFIDEAEPFWRLQYYFDGSDSAVGTWYGGSGSEPQSGTWTPSGETEGDMTVTIDIYQNTLEVNDVTGITLNSNDPNSGFVSISGTDSVTIAGGVLNFNSSDFAYASGGEDLHRISLGLGTTDSPSFSSITTNTANFNIVNSPEYDVTGTDGTTVISKNARTWEFGTKTLIVNTQAFTPQGVDFDNTGMKAFVVNASAGSLNVFQYNLTTPWDLTTGSYSSIFKSVTDIDSAPRAVKFSTDGLYMFIVGDTNDNIGRYTLTDPWNLSSITAAPPQIYVLKNGTTGNTQITAPQGVAFSTDGTRMFIANSFNNFIYQFNLSTPWSISTAVVQGTTINVNSLVGENNVQDVAISSDGTRLFIIGQATDRIWEFNLPTPNSLVGAVLNGYMRNRTATVAGVGANAPLPVVDEGAPTGLYYNDILNKCFYTGTGTQRIFEIIATPQILLTGSRPSIIGTAADGRGGMVRMNSLFISDGTNTNSSQTGALVVAGGIGSGGSMVCTNFATQGAAQIGTNVFWSSSTSITAPSNGILRISNNAGNDFARLQFGGTTAGFPAIRRNGSGIDIVDAANTDYTSLAASTFVTNRNIVTQADDFTISGADAGKYIRLTKPSGTQTIALTGSGILTGHEFMFYRATSAALALNGGIVNGGTKIASVAQYDSFGLKHLGSGTFDFI